MSLLYPKLEGNLELQNSESKDNLVSENKQEIFEMSISLEIAEKMLNKFDGNKSKLGEFIRNCDMAVKLIKPEMKNILFSIILTKLVDNAGTITSTRDFQTWEELKSYLIEIYSEKRTLSQWQLELNTCRQFQNESVAFYANRIEDLYVKIINSLNSEYSREAKQAVIQVMKNQTLHVFVTGLNKDLSLLVKSQKPDSLESAISIALIEEQEQKSKLETSKFQNIQFNNNKYCNNCHRNNHNTINCRLNKFVKPKIESQIKSIQNNSSNYQKRFENPNIPHNNNQNISQNHSQSNFQNNSQNFSKFCNYCKKKGHVIQECRKRAYNNNKNQNNSTNNISLNPNQSRINHVSHEQENLNSQGSHRPAESTRDARFIRAAFQ